MADNSSGRLGEQYAAERMKNDGYEIICTNYRSRFGEIDIIARRYTSYARPVEWVTKTKQNRIINTALMYLSEHKTNLNIRFDVIEIITGTREFHVIEYNHIKNAFMMGW